MSPPEPATLGQRLDRQARAALARRSETARRLAARDRPERRWAAPGERRLRVEADVPPAWDDDPRGVLDGATSPGAPIPFPAGLREQLHPVLGPGLDRVVLRDGDTDPAARAHDAAAVTVGQQTFRQGRGLLAHEAVHAMQSTRPGTAWRRATESGRSGEEQAAHAVGTASSSGVLIPFPAELAEQLRPVVGPGLDRVVLHDGDTDPAADALARAHGAAAVTVGQQIFLRQGRFRPRSPQGRGLLAHEAVHATQSTRPGTAWQRATESGRSGEEQAAHAVGAAVAAGSTVIGNGQDHAAAVTRTGTRPVVAARRIRAGAIGGVPGDRWSRGTSPGNHPDGRGCTLSSPADAPGLPAFPGLVATPHSGTTGALPGLAPTAATVSTSAAATPMAAPASGLPDLLPTPPSPGADLGLTREAVLRELMRQVRTDRERGA